MTERPGPRDWFALTGRALRVAWLLLRPWSGVLIVAAAAVYFVLRFGIVGLLAAIVGAYYVLPRNVRF